MRHLAENLEYINRRLQGLQLAVVAGGDNALYRELKAIEWNMPAHLYGSMLRAEAARARGDTGFDRIRSTFRRLRFASVSSIGWAVDILTTGKMDARVPARGGKGQRLSRGSSVIPEPRSPVPGGARRVPTRAWAPCARYAPCARCRVTTRKAPFRRRPVPTSRKPSAD